MLSKRCRRRRTDAAGMSELAAQFELPSRSVFEPPSYPNVWFYVHERVAASQDAAVSFVTGWLQEHCGITNDFGHWKPPEASDSQARLGGLQPWQGGTNPAQHHAHDLHIRYYHVALRQTEKQRVTLRGSVWPSGHYQRFAGSVHYEVADEHPLHPYIDDCPYCGRTGSYAGANDLFAGVHEPLGLELFLYGTIRGQPLTRPDGRPVGGVQRMKETHAVHIERIHPASPDMNIVDLAVVLISSK
jgi:hypothetical protein